MRRPERKNELGFCMAQFASSWNRVRVVQTLCQNRVGCPNMFQWSHGKKFTAKFSHQMSIVQKDCTIETVLKARPEHNRER